MSKPWHERPLWEKVYLSGDEVYLNAGKAIGHLGCTPFDFYDAVKKLPGYQQHRYENAVRDLTVYAAREGSPPRYELTPQARKVLRVILGPAPDDPEYAAWWRGRRVSVRQMQQEGLPVRWADAPPVPLRDQQPASPEQATRKPGKPRKRKTG